MTTYHLAYREGWRDAERAHAEQLAAAREEGERLIEAVAAEWRERTRRAEARLAAVERLCDEPAVEAGIEVPRHWVVVHDLRAAVRGEVWDDSAAPGGYVCATCGMPTESEPCREHGTTAHPANDGGTT